jgi:hypothetical protein
MRVLALVPFLSLASAFVSHPTAPRDAILQGLPASRAVPCIALSPASALSDTRTGATIAKDAFLALSRLEGPLTAWELSLSRPKAAVVAFAAAVYHTIATIVPAAIGVAMARALTGGAATTAAAVVAALLTVPRLLDLTLIYVAAMVERVGPKAALERSRALMRDNKMAFAACSLTFSTLIECTQFVAFGLIVKPFLLPLFATSEIVAASRFRALLAALAAGAIVFGQWLVFGLGDFFVLSKAFYEHAASQVQVDGS